MDNAVTRMLILMVMWINCGYYLSLVDDEASTANYEIPLEGCELPEREIPRPDKGSPYTPKPKGEVPLPELPPVIPE